MFKKDYLQRQFEAFGKVLAQLLHLRKMKDFSGFEKEFESAFLNFTSYSPEHIEQMNLPDFKKFLHSSMVSDPQLMHRLADLLYEKFHLYEETGEEKKADDQGQKCLYTYSILQNDLCENEFNLEIHYRVKELTFRMASKD